MTKKSQTETTPASAPSRWRPFLTWGERILTIGILGFVFVRLGPQLGALTGFGPTWGDAPAFTAVTLQGDTLRSQDLAGRVVVVNFWATWCRPCRLEMPALQKVHERYDPADVVVLGLATDVGAAADIPDVLEERGVTYAVALATAEQRRAFGGIRGIPTTFIIDRDGVVRHRVVGLFAPPALSAAVARLAEPDDPAGS